MSTPDAAQRHADLMAADPVQQHIETICKEAGLGVMVQVLEIIRDREQVSDEGILALDDGDVDHFYYTWLGPAIDCIEGELPVDSEQ